MGILDCAGKGPRERGRRENHNDSEAKGLNVRATRNKATSHVRIQVSGPKGHSPIGPGAVGRELVGLAVGRCKDACVVIKLVKAY